MKCHYHFTYSQNTQMHLIHLGTRSVIPSLPFTNSHSRFLTIVETASFHISLQLPEVSLKTGRWLVLLRELPPTGSRVTVWRVIADRNRPALNERSLWRDALTVLTNANIKMRRACSGLTDFNLNTACKFVLKAVQNKNCIITVNFNCYRIEKE